MTSTFTSDFKANKKNTLNKLIIIIINALYYFNKYIIMKKIQKLIENEMIFDRFYHYLWVYHDFMKE